MLWQWSQSMTRTPEIPAAVRAIRHEGFRNVFEYLALGHNPFPDPTRPTVWGTETLAGDWNGRLLVVLKDFAPTLDLEHRKDGKALYSHRAEFGTNRNLAAFLTTAGRPLDRHGGTCGNCGLLIASASYLLRAGDRRSGKIPDLVLAKSWPVLEFTLRHMPNLTDIVLCGVEAFETFRDNGRLEGDRKGAQSSRTPLRWRGYRVHCTTHPQSTAVNTRSDPATPTLKGKQIAEEDWRQICHYAFPRRTEVEA
jgi:hypothetical protein